MQIDFNELIKKQYELDKLIFFKSKKNYINTFNERKLALLVELGELSNEIKSFKYWSIKKSSKNSIILEEYADVLHFILGFFVMYNISGQLEFKNKDFILPSSLNTDFSSITMLTNRIFKKVCFLKENKSKKNVNTIKKILKKFILLGYKLKFNIKTIFRAYDKKNLININRQKKNY
jgi:dimeric dUTPase (all-alpha-NTP-PPase superfamily)